MRQTINHLDGVMGIDVGTYLADTLEAQQYLHLRRFEADLLADLPGEVRPDTVTCLRYLQAEGWNEEAALTKLTATLEWRMTAGVDGFLQHPPPYALSERYQQARVFRRIGCDVLGHPVIFDRVGHLSSSGCLDAFKPEEWWLLYAWELERCLHEMRNLSREYGRPVWQYLYLADAAGLSLGTLSYLSVLNYYDSMASAHYPELVHKVIVINAPSIFVIVWGAVCMFLDAATISKVEVHSDFATERLLELVDPQQLPRELGGECDVSIPAGCLLDELPSLVPEESENSFNTADDASFDHACDLVTADVHSSDEQVKIIESK